MKPHEAPFATHSSAARGAGLAGLRVLVADDRLPESLERRDPGRDVVERRAVEVDQEEVGGLGQGVGVAAVAQAAGGDEQAGGRLLRQPDQLDLALHGADQAVVEAVVVELVGDLEHDVAEAAAP